MGAALNMSSRLEDVSSPCSDGWSFYIWLFESVQLFKLDLVCVEF